MNGWLDTHSHRNVHARTHTHTRTHVIHIRILSVTKRNHPSTSGSGRDPSSVRESLIHKTLVRERAKRISHFIVLSNTKLFALFIMVSYTSTAQYCAVEVTLVGAESNNRSNILDMPSAGGDFRDNLAPFNIVAAS